MLISMTNKELHWDLKILFIFLIHSTLSISSDSAFRVFNDMATSIIS